MSLLEIGVILVKLGAKPDFNSQKAGLLIIFESFHKNKSYSLVFKDSKNGEKSFGSQNSSSRLAQDHLILPISQQLWVRLKNEWYHWNQ